MKFLEEANYDWMEILNFHDRPFRAKLIPSKAWKDLDRYRNDSVGLSNYAKKWRTRIEWLPEKSKAKFYKSRVAVGGEYDPDERQCIIQIHTDHFDKFHFTDKTWELFKYKFLQVLMHELIHFMQYDRRYDEWSYYVLPHKKVGNLSKDTERRYLSEPDEVQAYAHCIFLDYKMFKPNVPVDVLLSRSNTYNDSKTLRYILKTFDYDYKNNAAIPKLMNEIVRWERKYKHLNKQS
jgi:hypothetical protein